MWDSFQTSTIIAENFPFLCFQNLSCVCRNVPTYACFGPRTQVEGHFGHFITKNRFCLLKRLHFPFKHTLSQFNIWLDSKLALGLRVRVSLGNEGSSRKGYKIRCLQMPLFWFVSFANGIKRIREKTFCFDVRLGPNPRTWHTSCIHGVGWGASSKSCVGFICPKSHLCCLGNKQWLVHYPRTYFATCKQMSSDSLSYSHLKRKKKTNKGALTS